MLPYHRKLLAGLSGGNYAVAAVTLDGTNDYLTRGSDLTGNADGKEGTVSFWINLNSENGYVYSSPDGANRHEIYFSSGNLIFKFENSSNSTILGLESNANYTTSEGWVHVLASWDLANTTAHLYKSDVEDLDTATDIITNDTIEYTRTNHVIGANGTSNKLNTDLAEFYFAHEYIDLSVEANRRKFISADGKPVDLGTDGSIPTGNQPIIYLSNRPGDSASDFATNRGSGGNFTVNGSLTTPERISVPAVVFDGASSINRSGNSTGKTDGKTGLVSFWVKFRASGDSSINTIIDFGDNTNSGFLIIRNDVSNYFYIDGRRVSDGSQILELRSAGTSYNSTSGWVHVMASWDLANSAGHLYINGSDDEDGASTQKLDNTIDYTRVDEYIGRDQNAASYLEGVLAEFYFAQEYLDLSVSGNRDKFYNAGNPVNLGADGSTPTGSQPLLYFKGPATSFNTNLGSGGDYSVGGTLTDYKASPSD